ncbi:MAG: hypothetical protein MUC84_12730 [Solirubrobacteraceae bacterium]|nr:hypothetical protein [Solirubrobacteraceae bacterium]
MGRESSRITSATFGVPTASAPAVARTAPAFIAAEPPSSPPAPAPAPAARPAPAISSPIRAPISGPCSAPPEAAQATTGYGVSAVAAARRLERARLTSWRTAVS